ncbi:MAG: hypothetical protein JST59_30010 [Actinobacteria bacterium]|nr:hypothetical protein [Actinomycetota bacterium]
MKEPKEPMGDPEIDAMSTVARALTDLEEDARGRVLRWAAERYGATSVVRPPGSSAIEEDAFEAQMIGDDGQVSDQEIAAEAPEFEHFAELFAAAQPKTNEDKALVAAYWVQAVKGQDQWQSRALNSELKNLGHPIPNITDALSTNMRRKPQRIIQLRKSGSSRQANKTYKVTHEGLIYVQGMASGSTS